MDAQKLIINILNIPLRTLVRRVDLLSRGALRWVASFRRNEHWLHVGGDVSTRIPNSGNLAAEVVF
jgi:hypothetical protein